MNWNALGGVVVNLSRFVFYDVAEDGTGTLSMPSGKTCPLDEYQRAGIDRIMKGDPDPPRFLNHTIPGLAWPDNPGGYWIKISTGAINMALVDTVALLEDGTTLWADTHNRMYDGEDSDLIHQWIGKKLLGAIL